MEDSIMQRQAKEKDKWTENLFIYYIYIYIALYIYIYIYYNIYIYILSTWKRRLTKTFIREYFHITELHVY